MNREVGTTPSCVGGRMSAFGSTESRFRKHGSATVTAGGVAATARAVVSELTPLLGVLERLVASVRYVKVQSAYQKIGNRRPPDGVLIKRLIELKFPNLAKLVKRLHGRSQAFDETDMALEGAVAVLSRVQAWTRWEAPWGPGPTSRWSKVGAFRPGSFTRTCSSRSLAGGMWPTGSTAISAYSWARRPGGTRASSGPRPQGEGTGPPRLIRATAASGSCV